ncbi:MAG: 1,2-phenylacetyl-CoA epoxidase subunit PaaD [Myxococcota bacterium]
MIDQIVALAAAVPDPEIPVLTIGDLGMIRGARQDPAGQLTVLLTPTYSGCPATSVIQLEIRRALRRAGLSVTVALVRDPPWTTDWITEAGRRKLRAYGIAPPGPAQPAQGRLSLFKEDAPVACPQCGAEETELISAFGSTPCKALRRCLQCQEPFDAFKCH